jgi:hypothetical protein
LCFAAAVAAAAAGVELPPGLVCQMEVQVELLREDKLKDKAWLDGERLLFEIVLWGTCVSCVL